MKLQELYPKEDIALAIELVASFRVKEYCSDESQTIESERKDIIEEIESNFGEVALAYTEGDNGEPIEIYADLLDCMLVSSVDGEVVEKIHYNDLYDFIETELKYLNFDALVGDFL